MGRADAEAFQKTRKALAAGETKIFEATVVHENLLTRVDIIQRHDSALHVIEVKSSSFNSETDGPNPFRGKKGGIASEWREYLEDVAFQTVVLRRAFPELKVVPFLCIVDKAKSATENATFDDFRVRRSGGAADLAKPSVEYPGNADGLGKQHVLAILEVTSEVDEIIAGVAAAAEEFAQTLTPNPIQKIGPTIGQKCKKCEFRTASIDGGANGFQECWGHLAEVQPHVLDLFRVDSLGGKNRDVVARWNEEHRVANGRTNEAMQGAYAARQSFKLITRGIIGNSFPTSFQPFGYASLSSLLYRLRVFSHRRSLSCWHAAIRAVCVPMELQHHRSPQRRGKTRRVVERRRSVPELRVCPDFEKPDWRKGNSLNLVKLRDDRATGDSAANGFVWSE